MPKLVFPDYTANYQKMLVDKAAQAAQEAAVEQAAQQAAIDTNVAQTATQQPTIVVGVGILGAIAYCESTNNPRASNGTHFGLFQFDLPTWYSVGGVGNPMDASADEQYLRAQLLYNQRGTQPWAASQGCWG